MGNGVRPGVASCHDGMGTERRVIAMINKKLDRKLATIAAKVANILEDTKISEDVYRTLLTVKTLVNDCRESTNEYEQRELAERDEIAA
jgi:hypothetical protein